MTNSDLLEETKTIRDEMLNFLNSPEEIPFNSALKLNNQIALLSMRISRLQNIVPFRKNEKVDCFFVEKTSKINTQ